jgi:ABC-type glucose/galactose transport system permease subunit
MGRTVVEPVRVRVCFCPGVAGAVVAAGAAVVAGTTTCVAAALAGVEVAAVAAVEVVVPLLVQPATNIDTMSNAARHTVTNTYELSLVFMVFDHDITPC